MIALPNIYLRLLFFLETVKNTANESVQTLTISASSTEEVSVTVIEDALRALVPGGSITINIPAGNSAVKRNIMFSGFISVAVATVENTQTITANKPDVDFASSSSVKLNPTLISTESTWNFDMDDGEVDLIADSDLLKEDVSSNPVYDCGPGSDGKRKACKDCVCGLADEERADELEAAGGVAKSGCGSCAYGDAYRCATCPSLGKPSWKKVGDAVKLDL